MNYLKNFFSKQHLLRTALMISVASFVGIAISFGVIMFARAVAPTPSVNGGIPDGATDVPISTFVAVHFDNGPLDMTTVSTTSVILQANTGNTQGGAPTGPNFCLSAMLVESSSTIMCEHMSDNIPLTTSTWYTLTITTSTANLSAEYLANPVVTTFQTGNFDMNNNTTPPFVQNSVPQPGDSGFAINGNLLVTFPGGDQGNMATSGPGSVTSTANISLETVVNMVPSGTNICASGGCVLTWDGTNHILKINPASDLSQNADYVLILRKEITNVAGVALQGGQQDDMRFFHTSSGVADVSAPTIVGMNPASSTTDVQLSLAAVVVHFSKDIDQSTLNNTNVKYFADINASSALDGGETPLATTSYQYDAMQKTLFIGQPQLLTTSTQYCVEFTTGVKDTLGNALSASDQCFTTTAQAYVATAPTIMSVDADNFMAWVQYDQPISAVTAVAKSNYTMLCGTNQLNTSAMTFVYRPEANAVEIQGHGCATGSVLTVTVTGVKDISGMETIVANGTTNVGKVTVQNSDTTGGIVGGFDKPDFNNTNFGNFWENPTRCAPNTTIKGKASRWMCELSVPAAVSVGATSTLIITVPSGFDITSTTIPSGTTSFLNADLNGPGPGITTITSMTTNTVANTITLVLTQSGSAMNANDHIQFEFEGVVNSSIEGSNSASIVVKDASGVKQGQTITTAPFTIGAGGAYSLSGTVCKAASSGGACGAAAALVGVKVFIDSPQSGHQEATTDGSGNYTFTSLSAGQYNVGIFVNASQSTGGGNNFQSVTINGGNATHVDFKKVDVSSTGKTLTVNVSGPINTDLDVFCSAPNSSGFSAPVMQMLTTDGAGAGTVDLKLQPNTTYQCGIGPHIPFDTFSSGGPPSVPDFTFMPPAPKMVHVDNVDLSTSFVLITASNQVIGQVVGTDGTTGIANVFVDARPVGCFDTATGALKDCNGGFAKSKSDGTFVLNVTEGTYILSACAPGMPCSSDVEVTVKANTGASDNNATADVYANGTLLTSVAGQTIKMSKSSLTISGQVQDENSTAMQYAFVHAQQIDPNVTHTCSSFTPLGGDTGSPTDAQGNYTLYVSAGTWRVEAFAGTYGQVNCSIVTVGSSSLTGQNIAATTSDFATIRGTVTKNASPVQGANVNCFGSSGGNQTMSGSDGIYSMKVKLGTYSCDGFIPGAGPLTRVTGVDTSGGTDALGTDLSMGNPGTISIDLGSTITNAFCDARNQYGFGNGTSQNNNGVYTINVPADDYTVRCGNPDIGEVGTTSTTLLAGGANSITFTAPTLYQVTGRITDGSSNLQGASITLTDKSNARIVFKQSDATPDSNANVTVSVPAGTYSVTASKSGYVDSAAPQTLTVSATGTFTIRSLTKASAVVAITVQSNSSNYTGNAKVVATKSDGKVVTADVDKTTPSGANVSMSLTNGTWSIRAFADNGKTVASASTVTVTNNSTASPSTLTLDLSTDIGSGFTSTQLKPQQQSMIPSNGGLFKDPNISSNFELNIPSGALSTSDATAGTIETKNDPTLAISTPGKQFVGSTAIEITPTNSSGQKISDISSAATIVMPFDPTAIPSGVATSSLQCGAWDEAAGEWEMLPSSVDTTNNTITCQTTHFSTFGVLAATSGGTSDSTPAPTPSSSGGSSSTIFPPTLPTKPEAIQAIKLNAVYELNKATSLKLGSVIHTVTALNADASSATVVIESTPVTTTLALGEPKNIDTNGDSFDNLTVTYNGLDNSGKVKLEVVTLGDESETQGSVSINAGQYETNTTTVSVFLNVANATQIMFSNVANFTGATYVPYKATSTWTLTTGNGVKTLYVRFKSVSGGTVDSLDTIKLVGQSFEQTPTAPIVINCSLNIGEAYKSNDSKAVYYVTAPFGGGSDCTKRVFNKSTVFFTYFTSWNDVHVVTKEKLQGITNDSLGFMPWGPKFNPQYGVLIKSVSDPKVYLMIEGKKRWIDSEEAFNNLGYSWNWVEDVDQSLIDSVSAGDDITKDTGYPNGLLVKYASKADVYLLAPDSSQTGKMVKRHIKDMESFNTLGYRWDRIVTIPSTTIFVNGEEVASSQKSIVKQSSGYKFTLGLEGGNSGEEVKQLQLKLQDLGYLSKDIEATGYYGSATTKAVKAFQTAESIDSLGFVGPNTRRVLNSL